MNLRGECMRALFAGAMLLATTAAGAQQTVWRFDSVTRVAGHAVTAVGAPAVVETELGKAVHFNGHGATGDALFVDDNPLAGTPDYTFEVIFRPSSAGMPEQRFFHVQESASESRRMFELRIHDGKWCLDAVAIMARAGEPTKSGVILQCDAAHLFPLDRWYAIQAAHDGKMLRAYVDGALQGEIAVALAPLGPGGTSVGTRYTRRDFFTGDIFSARFTPRALAPAEFMRVPAESK